MVIAQQILVTITINITTTTIIKVSLPKDPVFLYSCFLLHKNNMDSIILVLG